MDIPPRSPFDTLETCFRLLAAGPACMALDGRHLGHGLPARPIPLGELRVLVQHPAATSDLQRAVVEELVHLAADHGGRWLVALAGMLLPGLRRIAASVATVDQEAADHVEADLLQVLRDAICQHPSQAVSSPWTSSRPPRPAAHPAPKRWDAGIRLGHERSCGPAGDFVAGRHRHQLGVRGDLPAARCAAAPVEVSAARPSGWE
jgi:hypothetical protein